MNKELVSAIMDLGTGEEVNIEGYVYSHVESDFGEDADGGRGVRRTFVDDVREVAAYKDGEQIALDMDDQERAEEILTRTFIEG